MVASANAKPHPINNGTAHKHANPVINPPLQSLSKSLSSLSNPHQSQVSQPDSGYMSHCGVVLNQSSPPDPHISNDEQLFHYGYNGYYASMTEGGDNDNDSEKLTNDFEPDDHNGTLSEPPLSQVIDDSVNESFSEMEQTGHPIGSQISYDVVSQPSLGNSQRFTHSPTNNYAMLTPTSQGYHNNSPHSSSQHGLDNTTGKSNLDSPITSGNNQFPFMSRSFERLSDIQHSGGRQMNASHDTTNNHSLYRTNNNNTSSCSHQPRLSQEAPGYSMGGQHDNYSMQQPDQFNTMVASQVDYNGYPQINPRIFSNMPGYPPRGGPPMRGGFGMDFGMRPEFDRTSVSSDYQFRNPYQSPASMHPQDHRRKQSMQEENMKMGRGQPHHVPYPDMFGYQRQFFHAPEDDPTIALSQPATFMMYPPHHHQQLPYNRYQNFQPSPMPTGGGPPGMGPPGMGMGPGMGMNRMNGNRLRNVPSGNSLSQGEEPRMRSLGLDKVSGKPRKSVLRTSGERRYM